MRARFAPGTAGLAADGWPRRRVPWALVAGVLALHLALIASLPHLVRRAPAGAERRPPPSRLLQWRWVDPPAQAGATTESAPTQQQQPAIDDSRQDRHPVERTPREPSGTLRRLRPGHATPSTADLQAARDRASHPDRPSGTRRPPAATRLTAQPEAAGAPQRPASHAEAALERHRGEADATPAPRDVPAPLDLRWRGEAGTSRRAFGAPPAMPPAVTTEQRIRPTTVERALERATGPTPWIEEDRGEGRRRWRQGTDCLDVAPSRQDTLDPWSRSTRPSPKLVAPC